MGCCPSHKEELANIEDPIRALINWLSGLIISSRERIEYYEPAYSFLNALLEAAVKDKVSSAPLLNVLTAFQSKYMMGVGLEPFDGATFLKFLEDIQTQYVLLSPTFKFDIQAKFKSVNSISKTLQSESLEEFFTNEAANFWDKNFKNKTTVTFEVFYDKWSNNVLYKNFLINNLPEGLKPQFQEISENLKLLMRYYLEANNNRVVPLEAWNVFYLKWIADYEGRKKFIEWASNVPTVPLHNKINLQLIWQETTDDFTGGPLKSPIDFIISETGLDNGFENKKIEKDLKLHSQCIKIGRLRKDSDIILTQKEVSKLHGEVSLKRAFIGNKIRNEYYFSNRSGNYTFFPVEERGYQIFKLMVFSLTTSITFVVTELYPPFRPGVGNYLQIEPEFLDSQRKPPAGFLRSAQKPFIVLECIEDAKYNKKFEAASDDLPFAISIGSGKKDTLRVDDIPEGEGEEANRVFAAHCYIHYDEINKCWVLKDKTVVYSGDESNYKTLVKCERHEQYEDPQKVTMRGIKLLNEMKVYVAGNVFVVKELD